MHSAPPTPAEHHHSEAEQGLAQLALLGLAIAAGFTKNAEGVQP